jgi:lipoprotein Spr
LLIKGNRDAPGVTAEIEKCSGLQFKYGILFNAPIETVTNDKLISFLEEWYGIPYKYGGVGKMGIDCSAFSSLFMDSVYSIDLPRTCHDQYAGGMKIRKGQLEQGDLVFFNTIGSISHVGIFLGNNKFVHASTSSGVMISDLDDYYFKKRYAGAVRVK